MKRGSTKTAVGQGMRALLLLLALLLASAGCNTTNPPVETTPEEESSTGEETTTLEETTDTEEETADGETTTEEETTDTEEETTERETTELETFIWNGENGHVTMESSFSDNKVIVIVMPFANFKDYTPEDFSEINCVEVRDLWQDIEPDKLCRIMSLTLEGHSKQNVLDAIELLKRRTDIYSAEPNIILKIDSLESESTSPTLSVDWDQDMISLPDA